MTGRGGLHVRQGTTAAVGGVARAAPVAVASTTNVPVCYQCGQPGHIRPNCPLRTPAPASGAARAPRLGSMLEERVVQTAAEYRDLPELIAKVKGFGAQDAAFAVEIRATVDS